MLLIWGSKFHPRSIRVPFSRIRHKIPCQNRQVSQNFRWSIGRNMQNRQDFRWSIAKKSRIDKMSDNKLSEILSILLILAMDHRKSCLFCIFLAMDHRKFWLSCPFWQGIWRHILENGTWMERGWNVDGTRMERGWNADGTRMDCGWNTDGTRIYPDGTRMERASPILETNKLPWVSS